MLWWEVHEFSLFSPYITWSRNVVVVVVAVVAAV